MLDKQKVDREKVLLSTLCAFLDSFHFDMNCDEEVDSLNIPENYRKGGSVIVVPHPHKESMDDAKKEKDTIDVIINENGNLEDDIDDEDDQAQEGIYILSKIYIIFIIKILLYSYIEKLLLSAQKSSCLLRKLIILFEQL